MPDPPIGRKTACERQGSRSTVQAMTAQDLRLESALAEMAALIARFTVGVDGLRSTAVRTLTLSRASAPTQLHHDGHNAFVRVIAQGAKRVMPRQAVELYDRSRYL